MVCGSNHHHRADSLTSANTTEDLCGISVCCPGPFLHLLFSCLGNCSVMSRMQNWAIAQISRRPHGSQSDVMLAISHTHTALLILSRPWELRPHRTDHAIHISIKWSLISMIFQRWHSESDKCVCKSVMRSNVKHRTVFRFLFVCNESRGPKCFCCVCIPVTALLKKCGIQYSVSFTHDRAPAPSAVTVPSAKTVPSAVTLEENAIDDKAGTVEIQ